MAKLGDLGLIITGNTPKTSDAQNYATNDICFVKPSDIADGTITHLADSEFYISEYARSKARVLPPKCILVTCIGIIGKVAINDVECAFNQQINAIVPNKNMCIAEYVAYAIQSKQAEIQDIANAPVVPIINKTQFSNIEIPIPSLEVQKDIVSKLDKISNVIALRKEQLAKLDQLVKSRFIELFGDPVDNPKGWKKDKAENYIDLLSGFPFDSSKYTESGVNICGGLIIMPQRIEWGDCKHWCSIDGYEEYALNENDIVIALDRPWISEGFKIAMVEAEHLPALLIQRTARIRAIGLNQFYLMYCFLLGGFDKHCNVTGSLVPHISAKDIRSFAIMLPPIDLQEQFAAFVEQTDKSKLAIQQSLDKLELLKKSLMQEYFG